MSYDSSASRVDERVQALLEMLDEADIRYQALQSSVEFQSAWVELAEYMNEVEQSEAYREWGYRSFWGYCGAELRLSKSVAAKLLEGYHWIEEQAPEYLPRREADEEVPAPRTRPVPDVDTAAVLAKGYREVQEERIPRATYDEIKEAALRGERTVAELRKEIKAAVPEHLREEPPANPLRHLRRALSEVDKAMMQIDTDEDSELLDRATSLRDAIFAILAERGDGDE
jgi:hypothetical protein